MNLFQWRFLFRGRETPESCPHWRPFSIFRGFSSGLCLCSLEPLLYCAPHTFESLARGARKSGPWIGLCQIENTDGQVSSALFIDVWTILWRVVIDGGRRGPATVSGAQGDRVGEAAGVEVALQSVAVDEPGGLEDTHSPRPLLPSPGVPVLHVHILSSEVTGGKVEICRIY